MPIDGKYVKNLANPTGTGKHLDERGFWVPDSVPGASTIFTVEKDLGYPAKNSGSFLITGLAGLTPNNQIVISKAAGPYTGKGDSPDEAEMDMVVVSAYVLDANTIKAHYNSNGLIGGNMKFNYLIQ